MTAMAAAVAAVTASCGNHRRRQQRFIISRAISPTA